MLNAEEMLEVEKEMQVLKGLNFLWCACGG